MEYSVGGVGRVLVIRLVEGESLYECVEGVAGREGISCGAVFVTGGFRRADVVVGPRCEKPRLEGNFKHFEGPGEVLGVGTVFEDDTGAVKMHLHAGMGRGDDVVVGCPRGGAEVFLVLEVMVIEFTGIDAARMPDPASGVKLLKILKSRTEQ